MAPTVTAPRPRPSIFGVTITGGGGPVYTDGRNWFAYNFADLNGITTLLGPAGLR